MTAKGYEISFWSDENTLKLDHADVCTTLGIYETPLTSILKVDKFRSM